MDVEAGLPESETAEPMGEVILSRWCERCVNDAAFQAGMVGAPRCPLIERALGLDGGPPRRPAEWRYAPGGEPQCSAFLSDIERDFHLADCA